MKMRFYRLILTFLALSLALLPACEQELDKDFEPEPNVFALMKATGDTSSQLVIVDQSYSISDTLDSTGVRDASVKVHTLADTFTFADSFYNQETGQWEKQPQGRYWGWIDIADTTLYSLEVILPWEDTVKGQAYMPTPVRISAPADSDTVYISKQGSNPTPITWNACANTQLYLIYCIPDVDTSQYKNYSGFLLFPSYTTDTSYAFFAQRMASPWEFEMPYLIRVIALSPAYVAYSGYLDPMQTTYTNLSAGYGVFAGISEDSVRVFIRE